MGASRISLSSKAPGVALALLVQLGLLCSADPALAGPKMYTATLSIEAFGNDVSLGPAGPFTAFPLGAHCNPYQGGTYCSLTTLQQGQPLTGAGTVSTTPAGGFSLPASALSAFTSGSLPPNYTLYSTYVGAYERTYASLRNQTGSFYASGGPGSFFYAPSSASAGTVFVTQGPNRFGGTMRLLGSLVSSSRRVLFSTTPINATGSIDWKFDAVGANAPTTGMGTVIGAYTTHATGSFYIGFPFHLPYPKVLTGFAFPWTTGSVLANVYRTAPLTSYSQLYRAGYDNRTTMGVGTLQLVSPMLTRWNEFFGQRTTAAVAILRIQFFDPPDPDSDNDGLLDSVETNTGVFVSASDTGTDPNNFDSDDDGLSDGGELGFGSNPNISEATIVFSHEGSTTPTDPGEGWTQTGTGTGVTSGPISADMGFDAWVVDDDSTVAGSTLGYLHTPGATPGAGWVLRGRVRIMDPQADPLDENASVHLEYSDGTTGYAMNLLATVLEPPTTIELVDHPVVFLESTIEPPTTIEVPGPAFLEELDDDYHLYELVFDPAASPPSADLFVNGVERISDYTGFPRTLARVVWGSFESTSEGEGRYNRVEFSTFNADLDRDGDGLADVAEMAAGTDARDPDSDDDGLNDGAEVTLGTDPLLPDTDGDGICDGNSLLAGCTGQGPDNCPLVGNPLQANTDTRLPHGNACQCGDVNDDDVVDADDRTSFQAWLVGNSDGGTFLSERCNVTGASEPGPGFGCDISDIFVISRFIDTGAGSETIGDDCPAFRP